MYQPPPARLDIVGLKEIAERLGVKQQTAAAWRHRGLLPPEEGTVSGAPAWRWETIEQWALRTGRFGAIAEFVVDDTPAIRVMDGWPVIVKVGVAVRAVSTSFPHQLPDGRVENHVRFQAAGDGQWYELPLDTYRRATGEASRDVGKALLAGAAALLGAIVLADQASKQPPGNGGAQPR